MNALASNAVLPAAARVAPPRAIGRSLLQADPAQTLWALFGFSVAMLLGFGAAALLDGRTLAGDDVWLKPAKFALSFVVLYATLALVVERLSAPVRDGRILRSTLAVMVVATWAEMAYIGGQAGRGVHSHFNVYTRWEALAYTLMGIGAVALVLGIGIIGIIAWRDRGARFGPALRLGIGLGFALSTVLTLVTAVTLGGQSSHFVGTPSAGAATIPFFGWSAEVGDLRPAHFLALHAMQALPLLGWWLDRRGHHGRGVMMGAAAAYALLTVAVFVQALMGLPLLRL